MTRFSNEPGGGDLMAAAMTTDLPNYGTATFAPTGTHSDALEAKVAMRDFLTRQARVTSAMESVATALPHVGFDGMMAQGIYDNWRGAVADDAALIYLSKDLVRPIVASSKTVPEIDAVGDLQFPPRGLVLFGQAIPDEYSTHAEMNHPEMYAPEFDELAYIDPWTGFLVTALTWEVDSGAIGYRDGQLAILDKSLNVTPWVSPAPNSQSRSTLGPLFPSVPVWLDGRAPRADGHHPDGTPYGWDGSPNHFLRVLVALSAWMESVITTTDEPAARQTRRRAERAGVEPSLVTYTKMRRMAHRETGSHDSSGREYTHRWVVSGHWRNQPCGPKRQNRRPVFVAPYVKGPADKPLIFKDRVWSVDR